MGLPLFFNLWQKRKANYEKRKNDKKGTRGKQKERKNKKRKNKNKKTKNVTRENAKKSSSKLSQFFAAFNHLYELFESKSDITGDSKGTSVTFDWWISIHSVYVLFNRSARYENFLLDEFFWRSLTTPPPPITFLMVCPLDVVVVMTESTVKRIR